MINQFQDRNGETGAFLNSRLGPEGPRKQQRRSVHQTIASRTLRSFGTGHGNQWRDRTDSYRPQDRFNQSQYCGAHDQSDLGGLATRIHNVQLDQRSQQASSIAHRGLQVHYGSSPSTLGAPLPAFQFSRAEIWNAKNTSYKVGDLVAHECIRQARLNPKWVWTDSRAGKWMYTEKDVHYVSTDFVTNPAVHFAIRNGIITEIYEGDEYYGPIAKIIPEFSYSNTGIRDKNAEFCAEHLGILHHDEAAQHEQLVTARNKMETNPSLRLDIEDFNPHPYAPWSAVLRLTQNSKHHPKENSLLRLTAPTLVYLHDPRLRKRGELDKRSMSFLRDVILKTQELGSYNHADRYKVDISKFPWLSHMDRFAARRHQGKGQAAVLPRPQTSRDCMPPPALPAQALAVSQKRKAEELDSDAASSELKCNAPPSAASFKPDLSKMRLNLFMNTVSLMSLEERRNAVECLQNTLVATDH
jgi:hypothetical protein